MRPRRLFAACLLALPLAMPAKDALGPKPLDTGSYVQRLNPCSLGALELAQLCLRQDGGLKVDRAKFGPALKRFRASLAKLGSVAPSEPRLKPVHNRMLLSLDGMEQSYSGMVQALAAGKREEALRCAARAFLFSEDLREAYGQFRLESQKIDPVK
jgi:hypothetical protein